MGLEAIILVFWMLSFKPNFLLSLFTFIKRLFSSSLSAIRVVSSAYLRLLICPGNLDSSVDQPLPKSVPWWLLGTCRWWTGLSSFLLLFIFICFYLLIWLHRVLVAARGHFSCGLQTLRGSTWDLVSWPGMEPGSPALRAWSLPHWTTREVPSSFFLAHSV